MISTNNHSLPEAMYNLLSRSGRKPVRREYHVTQLIGSPLQRILSMQHWDEIEEDVSERLWALLGSSVHYVLERGTPAEALAEETLRLVVGDADIIGTADLYQHCAVEDYKVTSVFAFLLGDKPEWEAQLNIYAAMYRHMGFAVDDLCINAILRDWQKSKSLRDPDYPKIPFQRVAVPLWGEDEARTFIADRVALHKAAEDTMTAPCCTDDERWARPTTFAVIKKGNKRAARVLDTYEAAVEWVENNMKGHAPTIEERPGSYIKCESYCSVRSVCEHNPYRLTTPR